MTRHAPPRGNERRFYACGAPATPRALANVLVDYFGQPAMVAWTFEVFATDDPHDRNERQCLSRSLWADIATELRKMEAAP